MQEAVSSSAKAAPPAKAPAQFDPTPLRINRQAGLATLAVFNLTLFSAAFLLFSVEPMVSRMVLPRLGGSPAVWNTCVCFFQAVLLLGYAYADWSAMRLTQARQVMLHGVVLLAGLALMPLSVGAAVPRADAWPALWLIGRLAVTIGPPFFAISATAPLMQHWFSRSSDRRAQDPYFLYASSNAGSLVALLSYPVLAEPLLGLSAQTKLWSAAFAICAVAISACGIMALWRRTADAGEASPIRQDNVAGRAAPVSLLTQMRWVALAFVPSGLMLAVTTYITTDIAAAPLFWVIPLAIYILTFMLAFGRTKRAMPQFLPLLQGLALAAAGITALMGVPNLLALGIALTVFTLTASVCHFELASRRPDARILTRYFLLISLGGALGGIFNALLAPILFKGPWEYPLLLIAACAIRPPVIKQVVASASPATPPSGTPRLLRLLAIAIVGAAMVYGVSPAAPDVVRPVASVIGVALPVVALLWMSRRGAYLGVGMASLILAPMVVRALSAEYSTRSFFGTYRVLHIPAESITVLQHGTTLHGVQGDLPSEARTPFGYYARQGPFGRLFAAFRAEHRPLADVGVIGLGIGGLSCYAQPGERWEFREIDPAVERIARDQRFFHFLQLCGNDPNVVLGDARVTLNRDVASRYDLLIVDAFSSDSIPAHLLTREALALYFSHLKPGGLVLFHISNRYLDLAPVVARVAQDAGASARHLIVTASGSSRRFIGAELIAVAGRADALKSLAADGWDIPGPGPVLWTDDRSDIAGVIRW